MTTHTSAADTAANSHMRTGLLADYLSKKQLAHELGVAVRTVNRWRHHRSGPKAVHVGGRIYFRREDVAAWLAQRTECGEAT